ncbi:sensor histidine kinase [Nannocystaceae bacterium ST9]
MNEVANEAANEAASRRLEVELRILAMLALLALLYFGQCLGWAAFLLDHATLRERLAGDPLATALIAVPGLALLVTLIHVALRMPSVRWPRETRGPSPVPLLVLGSPALLIWPWLALRDRRARARASEGEEIEIGFRALLDLPRLAGIGFGLWIGGATSLVGIALARALHLGPRLAFELLALWLTLLLPLVAIAVSRTRAMLVPEYIAAPRPIPTALPRRRSLRLRLGVPAVVIVIGVVLAPMLATSVWSEQHEQLAAREHARAQAEQLASLALRGDDETLGEFLADHPDCTVELGSRRYGRSVRLTDPGVSGVIDADGSERGVPLWVHRESTPRGVLLAIAPIAAPIPPSPWLIVLVGVLGLGAGLGALIPLVSDIDRDLGRSSRQVASVAEGRVPESLVLATVATRELRDLVAAVDRLVGRITDANVTKYVMIERAREVDRLKSQFLANMSHDLRSPLNSVLGFSELLQTGIEGELADEQRDMVRAIHGAGKQLLQQIDDILDTAKIEAGRVDLHREPTAPATLISRAIQRARSRLGGPIEYETTTAAGLPSAFVDPYRSVQVIENVLVFLGELLERGTLEIRCTSERGDNGTGEVVIRITSPRAPSSLEQLAHAQRGFSRLPGHTGLGLGLPIATSLLELQGGVLRVHHGSSKPDDETKRIAIRVNAAENPSRRVDVPMTFELRLPALAARRGVRLRLSEAMTSQDRSNDHEPA